MHKAFYLKTKSGQQIYSNGRMQFSINKGIHRLPSGYNGDFSLPVHRMATMSTPTERAAFLKKVEQQIGEPLVWARGSKIESVGL